MPSAGEPADKSVGKSAASDQSEAPPGFHLLRYFKINSFLSIDSGLIFIFTPMKTRMNPFFLLTPALLIDCNCLILGFVLSVKYFGK